jgi:hypothetical protein
MSHKRVSQLTELTAAEMASGDLFYVIDVSAKEGKKATANQLGAYLNASGSFSVVLADTASYVLGSNVHGSVETSSYSLFAAASVSSSWASRSLSASYSETASFAMNSSVGSTISASWASASISASWANVAGTAATATTATALSYPNTSTASYAITAGNVISSSYANTASYIANTGTTIATASYSIRSGYSDTSGLANVSLELIYPNVSTASYAIVAENFVYNHYIDYGIFLATTQSVSSSKLDLVDVSSSLGIEKQTNVTVVGTVIVPWTSSVVVDELLTLKLKSLDTGTETVIDETPIYFDVSRTVNDWSSLMSGSMKIPYSLEGSSSMLGNYSIFVTSSANIRIDSSRTNRFNLSSLSDSLTVSVGDEILFQVYPIEGVPITFYTGSHEGPFIDYRNGMLSSGSQNIESVDIRNTGATNVLYVWSLPNLRIFDCGKNSSITSLTGMPDTLVTLSCDSCSISNILSLSNTTMSYFHCGYNNLASLPSLPTSLSFLNCEGNNLTSISGLPNTMSYLKASENLIDSLPSSFPSGLTQLYLDNNQILFMPSILPDSILTMSVANNVSLTSWLSTLPTYLERFVIDNTSLTNLPTIPPSMSYLSAVSCSLSENSINTICSQSIVNGLTDGVLNFVGQSISGSTYANYVTPLTMLYGWTVEYDSITP